MEMSTLCVPVISVITGEGGSGGALALAAADRVYMLENAVYSVISPEGCASILWKDAGKVANAADALHITAQDMVDFKVAENIIPENFEHFDTMCDDMRNILQKDLYQLTKQSISELLDNRYKRFRKFGEFETK